MSEEDFSHLDAEGRIQMVDISTKEMTRRVARASCLVVTSSEPGGARRVGTDSFASSRLVGIQAAKRTAELVPLCHPLSLADVRVDVNVHPQGFEVQATVVTVGRTGVEMEALTACAFAALGLINSLVESEPDARLVDLVVLEKSGGKSGDWGRALPGTR